MTDCVNDNVCTARHGRVVHFNDVGVFEEIVDFHFAQGISLVLNAVAGDPLDGVPFLVGRIFDQIDEAESTAIHKYW